MMTGARSGDSRDENLDWEKLQGPVPMDLIDPEFPAHLPGAASEILPREESEALAREAGAALPPASDAAGPAAGPANPGLSGTPGAPASPAQSGFPDPSGVFSAPPGGAADATAFDPRATLPGGTTQFGADALADEFARIRAEMEAEAEAEKLKKQAAEREEAEQRQRLEQWMANARARLLKADADLAGPAGRVRIRKESSPSLYRLAEMQKTMAMDGDATVPDGSRAMAAQGLPPAPDPMATISVPTDQFLGSGTAAPFAPPQSRLDGIKQHTGRMPAEPGIPYGNQPSADAAAAQANADGTVLLGGSAAPSFPRTAPGTGPANPEGDRFSAGRAPASFHAQPAPQVPAADTPYPSGPLPLVTAALGSRQGGPSGTVASGNGFGLPPEDEAGSGTSVYRPMTREEALTRKVAKLRKVAEAGENTLALAPPGSGDGESRALNYAIAAVVLIAILVTGLGLFAATQAGLFDGLENRIPFLKPKIALPVPAGPADPSALGTARPKDAGSASRTGEAPAASATAPMPESAPGTAGPGSVPAAPASPAASAKASPAGPARNPALRNPAVTPAAPAASAAKTVRPAAAAPARPGAARPARSAAAHTAAGSARSSGPDAAPKAPARPARPAASAKRAGDPAAGADDDGEIPAYARARPKASGQAEAMLRNSVQAAASIGKGELRELYNRYALGYPGLSGEVVIGLTVDPGGRILEGSVVSSSTGVDAFDQDLLRKVMEWRLGSFPETRPKFVSVPFLFPLRGH